LTSERALIGSLGMSNVLSNDKKQQVIALGKLGWSLRRIEEVTGVRRETASTYLKAAGVAVCLPGWGRRTPAKPALGVTPDFFAPFSQKQGVSPPSTSVCEEYRELIEQGLARGRNGKAIWQDLVSDHGFAGGYQAVKRFVRKLRGTQRPESAGIILTAPGEEAQVDYGSGPMVRDPQTGKYRRTRLFVLTLGHSRKSVRLLSWRSSARIWAELHERAFRRLGGSPRVVCSRQLEGRRSGSRHLRSHCQPAVSRCARALRRGGAALPDPGSRVQTTSCCEAGTDPSSTAARYPFSA
jgi:transposase